MDRVQAGFAVLVGDDNDRPAEVAVGELPRTAGEGAVLRVPVRGGEPDWSAAVLDEQLRSERLAETRKKLSRLRKRDPGGDVVIG